MSGSTALISASEEDPHSLAHEWVKNEEGREVLAVAFLLDRRIHRPKVLLVHQPCFLGGLMLSLIHI